MTAISLAWRQIRHRPGYALLYALAVAVGGAVTGALGGYSAAVERVVQAQAKELWAADVTAEGTTGALDALETFAEERWPGATTARSVQTLSMVRAERGGAVTQASLSAVTPSYPLYGSVVTAGGEPLGRVLAPGTAVAAEKLLALLDVKVGDEVWAGRVRLRVADVLARRTDVPTGFFELAPALFISPADLARSELLAPGGRTAETLYVNLPAGQSPAAAAEILRTQGADDNVRVASWQTDNPGVSRFLRNTLRFLNFLGLLLLALGGVGVATALSAALAAARPETGVLLALGAPRGWIARLWAAWAGILTVAGLAGAAVLGAWGGRGVALLLKDFLPAAAETAAFSWGAAGRAALAAGVSTLTFALFPLLSLMETPPNAVLSYSEDAAPRRRWTPRVAAGILAAAAWALVARLHAGSPTWAAAYLAGGAGAVAAAWALAWMARAGLARAASRSARTTVRLAARGLARPGAMNVGVVAALALSIGLGLSLYLLERNMRQGFSGASPEGGPTAFFVNLRPADLAPFRREVPTPVRFYPLVRGRVVSVNGTPTRDLQARSEKRRGGGDRLTREFGFTFGDELPSTDKVVAGPGLWDPAIAGPQVSVFDEYRDKFGIRPGDKLVVTVLGRRVEATVSSLRSINQSLRQPFFYFLFNPGTLEGVPHTLMGGAALSKEEILSAEKKLARALPHVTVIDLADVAALTGRILNRLARAVTALGAVGVAGGLLLLGASLGVTLLDRARESVLFRTLGATRGAVTAAYALEFFCIGCAAALAGGVVGVAAAGGLTVWGLEMTFHAPWGLVAVILAGAALLVTALSLAVARRALRASPMEVLRYE